jgi:antitoxin YefM
LSQWFRLTADNNGAVNRGDDRNLAVLNGVECPMPQPGYCHGVERAAPTVLVEVEPGAEVIPVGEQDGRANPGGWIAEERADLRDNVLVERVALLGASEPEHGDGIFDFDADQIVSHPAREGLNLDLATAYISVYPRHMRILSISKIKDKLNEYVDAVALTQEQITITKNGAPAAVLVGVDEWDSLQETLYWLSQPGITESIAQADEDITAGRTYGEDEIRADFGVPRRPH